MCPVNDDTTPSGYRRVNLYILFHERSARHRHVTVAGFVRLCLRRPQIARQLASGWLIALFAGSELTHVSLGDDEVVLSSRVDGPDRWHALIPFVESHPGLAWMIVVPADRPVDLCSLHDGRRKSLIRTFARRITGGRIATRDCVTTATRAIRLAGLDPPGTITTPVQLYAWLWVRGYETHDLRDSPADTPEARAA